MHGKGRKHSRKKKKKLKKVNPILTNSIPVVAAQF
jgi:hypothetical protein